MFFKIFPGQADKVGLIDQGYYGRGIEYTNIEGLTELIKTCDVVIIHQRNPIYREISDIKAKKIRGWEKIDTTNVRIDFNITKYLRVRERDLLWIKTIKQITEQENIPTLNWRYETFPYNNIDEFQSLVHEQLEPHVDLGKYKHDEKELLKKQDLGDPIKSIDNWTWPGHSGDFTAEDIDDFIQLEMNDYSYGID